MSSQRLRLGRRSVIGQTYIITTVCGNRSRLFEDPAAAQIAIDTMRGIERQRLTSSFAWVVMPDHVHWMLELRAESLGDVSRRFKSSCALALNRRTGKAGMRWQPGYHDHAVRSDESLHRHAMYIIANPVRAGLTRGLGEYPFAWCRWPLDF